MYRVRWVYGVHQSRTKKSFGPQVEIGLIPKPPESGLDVIGRTANFFTEERNAKNTPERTKKLDPLL